MKIKQLFLFFFCVPLISFSQSQGGMECLDFVKKLEDKIYSKQYTKKDKAAFLHYTSKVTDWDNLVVVAPVKIYRKGQQVHFFSDKANIFQDENDVLLTLHDQKMVIWNKAPPAGLLDKGFSDEFLGLRNEFFKKCEIISCSKTAENENIKVLVLKAPGDQSGLLFINKITYRYDVKEEKVLKTVIEYNSEYKIKKMEITYHELHTDYAYNFSKAAWKQVLDKNYKPVNNYRGYELIDNRKD